MFCSNCELDAPLLLDTYDRCFTFCSHECIKAFFDGSDFGECDDCGIKFHVFLPGTLIETTVERTRVDSFQSYEESFTSKALCPDHS